MEQVTVNTEPVLNACQCRICGATADKYPTMFVCQENKNHCADLVTGIFSDLSYTPESNNLDKQQTKKD